MSYQAEKFNVARSSLMLPHPQGEEFSIVNAMHSVMLGLTDFVVPADFNFDAASQVEELKRMMVTDGLVDEDGQGLYMALARSMNVDERHRFSTLVDELAWYFSYYERDNA